MTSHHTTPIPKIMGLHLRAPLLAACLLLGARALKLGRGGLAERSGRLGRGYLTTGFGETFRQDAEMLCESVKKFEDSTPVALLTSAGEAMRMESEGTSCFDLVIPFHVNESISLPHERFNVDPMLRLLEVLPFQETIFFDSDVLRTKVCDAWDFMRRASEVHNQAVMFLGRAHDCNWHWKTACKLSRVHKKHFTHTHAGFMYIRLDGNFSTYAREFFGHAQEATRRYDELGFLKKFKGGSKCLEIHWSYAYAQMGWWPIEFGQQDMFCFNWQPGEEVPPRHLRVDGLAEPVNETRFCHAHMFERGEHEQLRNLLMDQPEIELAGQPELQPERQSLQAQANGEQDMIDRMRKQGANMTKFFQDLTYDAQRTRPHPARRPNATFQYGFFMQASNNSMAVQHILERVRQYYPKEKFLLLSDRSLDYSGMCKKYSCSFAHAGQTAGIWGDAGSGPRFLRRVVSAMRACDCETLVLLEDDTCLHGPLGVPPPSEGDIGGVPWPFFPNSFLEYAQKVSGLQPHAPEVWGCTGGCYFRVAGLLEAFERKPEVLDARSELYHGMAAILGERAQYGDVYPVAAAMVAGATVAPWQEVSEAGSHWDAVLHKRKNIRAKAPARLEHKCKEQLDLRSARADVRLARPLPNKKLDKLPEDVVWSQ